MTTRGRHRCACRRVLLALGDEPHREQVGVGPRGPRVWEHTREGCGPVTPLSATPPRHWSETDRDEDDR
jgi:hypothetical protein